MLVTDNKVEVVLNSCFAPANGSKIANLVNKFTTKLLKLMH